MHSTVNPCTSASVSLVSTSIPSRRCVSSIWAGTHHHRIQRIRMHPDELIHIHGWRLSVWTVSQRLSIHKGRQKQRDGHFFVIVDKFGQKRLKILGQFIISQLGRNSITIRHTILRRVQRYYKTIYRGCAPRSARHSNICRSRRF